MQGKGLRSAGLRRDCKFKWAVRAGSTEEVILEQGVEKGRRASHGDLWEKEREESAQVLRCGSELGMCLTGPECMMDRIVTHEVYCLINHYQDLGFFSECNRKMR